ncbi:MAG: hypothetical protein SNJ70_06185, partial [Armatimonadota bacterium]
MKLREVLNKLILVVVAVAFFAIVEHSFAASIKNSLSNNVTDIIIGNNTKGPYTLSYSNIDSKSLSAIINGRSLKLGRDIKLDNSNGIIAFEQTLLKDAIVKVNYNIIPGKSKKIANIQSVPLDLNIIENDNQSLSFTGLYKQGDLNNPSVAHSVVDSE